MAVNTCLCMRVTSDLDASKDDTRKPKSKFGQSLIQESLGRAMQGLCKTTQKWRIVSPHESTLSIYPPSHSQRRLRTAPSAATARSLASRVSLAGQTLF